MKEKYIKVKDYKIRYLEDGGSNGYILLAHGLGGMAERWARVIPLLSKKYHVIALDLIGFGYSDKPSIDYTPENFTKFIFDFLDALGINRTCMIGSSLGGQIAMESAIYQSSIIEKLVLVSPSGMMKNSTPTLDAYTMAALYPSQEGARIAFEMMSGTPNKVDQQVVDSFIERMSQPNAKMAFMSTILGLKNSPLIKDKLSKISMPTLIVWGSEDTMIPIAYANDFVSSIRNCQFVAMKGCGHTPHVEEPEMFSDIVLKFLSQ